MSVLRAAPQSPFLRRDLEDLLASGRASDGDADRVAYARDLWPRHQIETRAGVAAVAPPAVVVWPESAAEVAKVVRYAKERGIPLVPFGAGSGVCGGVLPTPDTILLDLKRMRAIHSIDADLLRCKADAGIVGQHLEDALDEEGFTLGHFPSSIYCSTLGGWLAARSAGQCSGRYGKIEDMILSMTVVDGAGEIHRAVRDGENADLLPLVIGSEGILGIITDACLRIAPAPKERRFASFSFPTVEDGLHAIRRIYQSDLRPAVARLYDPFDSMLKRSGSVKRRGDGSEREDKRRRVMLEAIGHRFPALAEQLATIPGASKRLGLKTLVKTLRRPGLLNEIVEKMPVDITGGSTLILVWELDPRLSELELLEAKQICEELGGEDTGEEPGRHWLAHRHSVSYRQSPMLHAGAFIDTMEVAATWSRLLPMYHAVKEALGKHVFVMAHFSHAYPDGASIYFTFAGSAQSDEAALEAYDQTWRDALDAVVRSGGTLSHHHGVGRSKAPTMRAEQGAAIDVVRELKAAMDPAGILNEGSLLPRESDDGH